MAVQAQITESQYQQYGSDGYCVVKGLMPTRLIEHLRDLILALAEDRPDWPDSHFHYLDPARYAYPDGTARPSSFQRPASRSAPFADVADHPNLRAAMARLLGGDVERYTDQVGIKFRFVTEQQGGMSFFHQDSAYWHIDPELGCNCWLPMETVGPDSSALAVMPGSHLGWHLTPHESYLDDPPMGGMTNGVFKPFARHRIPAEHIESAREVLLPMSPGDALFFTNYTKGYLLDSTAPHL